MLPSGQAVEDMDPWLKTVVAYGNFRETATSSIYELFLFVSLGDVLRSLPLSSKTVNPAAYFVSSA